MRVPLFLPMLALFLMTFCAPKPDDLAADGVAVKQRGVARAIYSGVPWLDTAGHLINAHGIGIFKEGNTYYMVGEKRTDKNDATCGGNPEDLFVGINLYSSTDLMNWTFLGTPILPNSGPLLSSSLIGERPKLYYNEATQKYFILVKTMKTGGHSNHYVISSADRVTGPYTYLGSLMYGATNPARGDVNVFVDSDGSGYLIVPDGKIYKLSPDYLRVESVAVENVWGSAVPWQGYCQSEGPGFFKAKNTYFLLGSHGTFWNANDNFYATAPSINGPWTYRGLFAPPGSMTWNSQSGFVLPVLGTSGTTYIYMGDRWVNSRLTSSTLVWQPITVDGSFMSISTYHPGWTLDVHAGTWNALNASAAGTTVNDSETGTGPNQFDHRGSWSHSTLQTSFGGDVTTSSSTDSVSSLAFTGTQVFLYSAIDNDRMGIMAVTLKDDKGAALTPEVFISLRTDASPQGNYLVYASPVLPRGSYVLEVRPTGLKDHSSLGTTVAIDRAVILDGPPPAEILTPYLRVNAGGRQQTATTTVFSGARITFSPEPVDGTWTWTGPNGFTAATREISLDPLQTNAEYIATYNNILKQVFSVQISLSSGRTYLIINKHSGKALEVSGDSLDDGARIVQMPITRTSRQKWIFTQEDNGHWKIQNARSGKLMDIEDASTADGAQNIQWRPNGGSHQLWQLEDAGGNTFKIRNKYSGKILDIANASTEDGAQNIQWPDNGGANQIWKITPP